MRELEKQRIIGQAMAQKLEETLILILSLRLRAQLFYQTQREILYYAKEAHDPQGARLCLIEEKESQLALDIYRTLIPLQKLMQAFVQRDQRAFLHASCYDANEGTRNQEAEKALNYQAAENAYLQQAALKPHDVTALIDVQRIKMTLGQAKAALGPALDALTMLRNKHGDSPHSDIADSLNNLGVVYERLGELQPAKDYYEQSLAMLKQLFGDPPHRGIATSLYNLGMVYQSLGEMQQAKDYHEQSLAMKQKLKEQKGI